MERVKGRKAISNLKQGRPKAFYEKTENQFYVSVMKGFYCDVMGPAQKIKTKGTEQSYNGVNEAARSSLNK